MRKRRYIKRAYIEEIYCDKCGSKMAASSNIMYPITYTFVCTNQDCCEKTLVPEYELPIVRYEFDDGETL